MQIKRQQLDPDMEWTGSKLGKEHVKAIYCHPAYLTYRQSTPCEMPGWMKPKPKSRLPGESQGRRSLMGCRVRGRTELDMTKAT